MNVTCPSCSTVFRVDPAKVPAGGVRARCSVCRTVFRVESGATAAATPPAPAATIPPARPAAPSAPSRPPAPPAAAAPAADRVTAPPFVVPPPAPQRPAAGPGPAPAAPSGPHVRPPFSSRPVSIATPSAPRAAAPRPSVNPFLSKDPGQKARRLARALVSDIVVYHPEKRVEGLRHGTLKQIFDEEIKKSWEEYAGQVGRELAESTSHFNDALNEILGDGSKIF
ncbi:MAG TPA: zinc-ribbon domain-containing protein [Gemmatimonadales bacterium]|nr:zinc-ribbon domain-containing protein [Gemmatimonadales bacterium]